MTESSPSESLLRRDVRETSRPTLMSMTTPHITHLLDTLRNNINSLSIIFKISLKHWQLYLGSKIRETSLMKIDPTCIVCKEPVAQMSRKAQGRVNDGNREANILNYWMDKSCADRIDENTKRRAEKKDPPSHRQGQCINLIRLHASI